jgi:hypothetical protein
MKFISVLVLLFVMSANLALSVVEQLCGEDIACQRECSTDDTDEEKKNEKEEKEKEVYLWKHYAAIEGSDFRKHLAKSLFPDHEGALSDAYTLLPEIPPDAIPTACSKV